MKTEIEILRDLVAIPSVSSLSNVPVVNHALRLLDAGAWNIQRHPYTDPAGTAKLNVIATSGSRSKSAREVELALVCHTDTVPFDEAWPEAVHPRVRGGKLYGRGSCDVKGFLACVLAAVSRVDVKRLAKPLAVVLTADEEIGCVGVKQLARMKALRSRFAIVGEPTGLQPVRAGKGYGLAEIVVHGKEAHSAFPAKGRSAINDAARVITRLEHVARKLTQRKNRDFDPPFTTLNAGLIRGGTAKNIIAGECRITVEWRPVPGQPAEWTVELIAEELAQLARKNPGFSAVLDVKRIDPAFDPSETRDLAALLESLTGYPSTTVAFGTEAAHIRSKETVVFGPGDMTVAHQSGEFVPVAELTRCAGYLATVIGHLCG